MTEEVLNNIYNSDNSNSHNSHNSDNIFDIDKLNSLKDWFPEKAIFNKNIELPIDRIAQYKKVQKEAIELFEKKNQDYGDAFANYGTVGVLVRLGDKIARCQSISNKGISLVQDEKLRDTLIDLHNYAAMAIMLLDEDKK